MTATLLNAIFQAAMDAQTDLDAAQAVVKQKRQTQKTANATAVLLHKRAQFGVESPTLEDFGFVPAQPADKTVAVKAEAVAPAPAGAPVQTPPPSPDRGRGHATSRDVTWGGRRRRGGAGSHRPCVPPFVFCAPGAGSLKFRAGLLRMAVVPNHNALSRLLLVFGLSGWALMLSLVAAALLFLKVVDWPSVGWFVDASGGFAGFGFIRAGAGWREVLGSWSLPIFASTAAVLAWIGALGTRSGIRTLRTLLGA